MSYIEQRGDMFFTSGARIRRHDIEQALSVLQNDWPDYAPKKCASQKKFCFQCKVFPCKKLQSLDKRYRTKYDTSVIENLLQIKTLGVKKFLQSEKKFTKNGKIICMHDGKYYKIKNKVS